MSETNQRSIGQSASSPANKPAERKRYPILDWAYYHGPNAQRLATIASLVVGNLAVIAVAVKYVVS